MKTAKRLEGVGEYYFSQKLREIDAMNREGKQVINLGIGSPDLPPHPEVIRILQEASAQPDTHAYQSYKGIPVLRQAIARWYRKWYHTELDADTEILPLLGSKEGLMHICMTYLNDGDEVLVPDPGYPTYRSAATLAGGICREYDLTEANGWLPDIKKLEQQDVSGVKLMFINYPHMPTGQLATHDRLVELVAFAQKNDILLVHDNPYSFILNDQLLSILSIPGARDCAVELNSLSKSHNMAGWRIGVLCGAAQRITEVLRFKSNMDSGMFMPLQLAAARALELDIDWHDELNAVYMERRQKVFALLELLQCRFDENQVGMFVWAAIPGHYENAYALSDKILQEAQVFLTPGGIFGKNGNRYLRVSLCATNEKIQESTNRIKKIV